MLYNTVTELMKREWFGWDWDGFGNVELLEEIW